jgi:hypothetical protein
VKLSCADIVGLVQDFALYVLRRDNNLHLVRLVELSKALGSPVPPHSVHKGYFEGFLPLITLRSSRLEPDTSIDRAKNEQQFAGVFLQ